MITFRIHINHFDHPLVALDWLQVEPAELPRVRIDDPGKRGIVLGLL